MKTCSRSVRLAAIWLLASLLPLVAARAADEAAIKAEIEAVRKATLERLKDRLPENFEDFVRETGTRNYYRREFTTALTHGNATALAVVLKEFPEFARPAFLNSTVAPAGRSALLYAVEQGHTAVVELLLAQKVGADAPRPVIPPGAGGQQFFQRPPSGPERRTTPLHAAVRTSRLELAKRLLDEGADVNALDERGESALSTNVRLLASVPYSPVPAQGTATEREVQDQLLTLLLARGAAVLHTQGSWSGLQPIAVTFTTQNDALLDRLLTNCVPLAGTNYDGDSLVHVTVMNGRTNALAALLAKRAPASLINRAGFTPLQALAWLRPPPPPPKLSPNALYVGAPPRVYPAERAATLRQSSADQLLAAGAVGDVFSLTGLARTNELAALLRRDPTQASARDLQGRSPMHYAVQSGGVPAVQALLQAKAPTELRDASGQTPLLFALTSFRRAEAEALVLGGANVSATNTNGQTALHLSMRLGNTNLPAILLGAGADLNARDTAGKSPVEAAAAASQFTLVKWLEAHGAVMPTKTGRLMSTRLHQAIRNGSLSQLEATFTPDTDVNARDEQGRTALRLATDAGRADLAHLLFTRGANPNLADTNGVTPLHARFLAASDPAPDPTPKPGFSKPTAKSTAAKPTTTRTTALPPELQPATVTAPVPPTALTNVLLLLLENGADPKLTNAQGHTLFHLLQPPVQKPSPELLPQTAARLRLLVAYGLPVDARSPAGATPLQLAASRADLVHTFALLEAGAQVNAADARGCTVLHHALTFQPPTSGDSQWQADSRRELTRTLALLLDNEADLRRADAAGATALHRLPGLDEALRDTVLPVLQTNRHFTAALRVSDKAGKTPVLLALDKLRAQPDAGTAQLLLALLDAGGELPPPTGPGGASLLHELASLGVSGTSVRGFTQPDSTTAAAIARLTAKLVTKGAKVDLLDAAGETPLHRATRHQNVAFATLLLTHGANPNAQNPQGDTPVHLALRELRGDHMHPVIPVLASHSADLGRRNAAGETPLRLESTRRYNAKPYLLPPGATQGFMSAVQAGDLASVNAYLSVDPAIATANSPLYQFSAVRTAALNGHKEMAEALRAAGAVDPVSAAVLGWTNSLAAFVHENPMLAETTLGGPPLLHLAASRGQLSSVRLLLTPQVAPGFEDITGRTPFFFATTNGHPELRALLAARGVRGSIFDALHMTDTNLLATLIAADPARARATNRFYEPALLVAAELGKLELVQQLLALGADANQAVTPTNGLFAPRFVAGTVPLHLAAASGRLDLAEALVSGRANVSAANVQGYTALHFAVALGQEEMVAWLLARGADANAPVVAATNVPPRPPAFAQFSSQSWTPLHLAVRYAHTTLVELLVAKGGKLTNRNAQGLTAAEMTAKLGEPWPPAPYLNRPQAMLADPSRDPARAQAMQALLRKLATASP